MITLSLKMKRKQIIQTLIDKYNYTSYLEIGLNNGKNIAKIKCPKKVGVDPNLDYVKVTDFLTYEMTSDEYFNKFLETEESFDIIFIDGLHHCDQVYKDIKNSLKMLNENGTIVCHDMNPTSKKMQEVPRISDRWTGDCWKAWIKLRQEKKDLCMYVINADYGCGIIQNGSQELLETNTSITYENFANNKKEWLNLISIKEFEEKINEITAT